MLRALVAATLTTLAFAAPASASEWAHPVNIVPVRAQPDAGAKRVTVTRMLTEDKLPEVYLVLERSGKWVKVRVPGRPNGRKGWVRRDGARPDPHRHDPNHGRPQDAHAHADQGRQDDPQDARRCGDRRDADARGSLLGA